MGKKKKNKKTNYNYTQGGTTMSASNNYISLTKNNNGNGVNYSSSYRGIRPYSYGSFGSLSNKTQKTYEYKGTKNKTEFPEFIELCKATQEELKKTLPKRLIEAGYTDVVVDDGYIYAKGTLPYLVTAHMDTVHSTPVIDFYENIDEDGNHIIASPQGIGGDDRCGIYMILEIIKDYKPSVLFCEDEESGGIGSTKFCKSEFITELEELKYLIELDRMNGNDAVFYECENAEFTDFIVENTGYKESYGSFSDISHLAPKCGVAAVNLSCGYYHAHTKEEEVNVEEMLHTIKVVKRLFEVECKQFEYIEAIYDYNGLYGRYSYGGRYSKPTNSYFSNNRYDYYDDNGVIVYVNYIDPNTGESKEGYSTGDTKDEAFLNFFKEYSNVCMDNITDWEYDWYY